MENNEINKELREIAPTLENYPGTGAFEVPEDYFDQLPGQINSRISREGKTQWSFSLVLLKPLTVAAVMLAFVAASLFFLRQTENGELYFGQDNLIYDEYLAWYTDYATGDFYEMLFDEYPETIAVFDDEDLIIEYMLDYHGEQIHYYVD